MLGWFVTLLPPFFLNPSPLARTTFNQGLHSQANPGYRCHQCNGPCGDRTRVADSRVRRLNHYWAINITGINPEAVKWGVDRYDRPLCPGLQPSPPSQTPGGLGQRYWSVSEVTWPLQLELRRWQSSGPSSVMKVPERPSRLCLAGSLQKKILVRFKYHIISFLMVQLTITKHWFR